MIETKSSPHPKPALLSLAVLCLTLSSCTSPQPQKSSMPNLAPTMTDAEILQAFGLSPAPTPERIHGKDGTSTTYTQNNQSITITRSLISGLTILATGPHKGVYPLGKPPATTKP